MPATRTPPFQRLSVKLLLLTVIFVMLAEVLIFLPSVARYRETYLTERCNDAYLAMLAVRATPDGMVDRSLQKLLLDNVGALGIRIRRHGGEPMMSLGPDLPLRMDVIVDLTQRSPWKLIRDAIGTMLATDGRMLVVRGLVPQEPGIMIEVTLAEEPLRRELWAFALRILWLSLAISAITATLVYLSLAWLLVRPMRRLVSAMALFSSHPESARAIIEPSGRGDEIGVAERALMRMQNDLQAALAQKNRLAAVGTAVTKISHDLRGILSTAVLVSDALETSDDPEVRRVAPTLVRTLDRAVDMCTTTLRFVREGPARAILRPLMLVAIVCEVADTLRLAHPECAVDLDVPDHLVVQADQNLLFRILENLGRNAAQAGATRVTMAARADGDDVAVRVCDNGPGLPEAAQADLFKPFAGSTRQGGSGLGLAIAHELATAQGGSLALESTGADGTCFRLMLRVR